MSIFEWLNHRNERTPRLTGNLATAQETRTVAESPSRFYSAFDKGNGVVR